MPFLQFLPWCPIDSTYEVGEITLAPYALDVDTRAVGDAEDQVRSIFSAYRGIDGRTVPKVSLITFDHRPALADVSASEMEITRELVELACVCGLAKRALFDHLGLYCNADCFVCYGQRLEGKSGHVGVVHRRRDGSTCDLRSLDRTVFSIPLQVSNITRVTLDAGLLAALLRLRESAPSSEWGRWQNAISCFNQANTDGHGVSPQVESVLICSAFERLLTAPPKAKEVARLFSEILAPLQTISVGASKRISSQQGAGSNSLRYEWMKEFYKVRGDFAHGKLRPEQPMIWSAAERLVLASISFPLCMKTLLVQKGHYSLTDDDQVQIDAFEALADQDGFLAEPADSSGSSDSWWRRCLGKARKGRCRQKAIASLSALNGKGVAGDMSKTQ